MTFDSREYDEKIRTLRVEKNLPPSAIAKILRNYVFLTTSDVRARLDAMGVPARKNTIVTPEMLEEIKTGLLNGTSYRDLMMKYGISTSVISNNVRKWGMSKPKSGPINDEILRDKYVNQLWGVAEITREYGWCRERVYRRLHELGISRRSYAVKQVKANERLEQLKLEGRPNIRNGALHRNYSWEHFAH